MLAQQKAQQRIQAMQQAWASYQQQQQSWKQWQEDWTYPMDGNRPPLRVQPGWLPQWDEWDTRSAEVRANVPQAVEQNVPKLEQWAEMWAILQQAFS